MFLATAFTPLPNVLSRRLVAPSRIEPADAIVVLGGGLQADWTLSSVSVFRALKGIDLKRKGLAPLLVFLGEPRGDSPPEAEIRAHLARNLGIPPETILTEPGAQTTREEATRISMLLHSRGVRRILLVTDSHHMVRARRVFEQAGFQVLAAPADELPPTADSPEERLKLVRALLQELVARIYYDLAVHR